MALGFMRLEECTIQTEALASDKWYVSFFGTEKVEYAATVTVKNGNIVAYIGGLNNIRMSNRGFIPVNRIIEENQEQRVINEISKQQNGE